MPDRDLNERLQAIDRLEAPDLWGDIRARKPVPDQEPNSRARLAAVLVAAAGVAVGMTLLGRAFLLDTSRPPDVVGLKPAATPRNGALAFSAVVPKGGGAVFTVDPDAVDGLEPRRITVGRLSLGGVTWSPDGSRLAVGAGRGKGSGEILVMNADGTGAHVITSRPGLVYNGPVWSPTGTEIAFFSGGGDLYLIRPDGSGLRKIGTPKPRDCSYLNPSWAPAGGALVVVLECFQVSGDFRSLVVVPTEGGSPHTVYGSVEAPADIGPVNPKAEDIADPSWGKRSIAFTRIRNGQSEIWSISPEGVLTGPLTSGSVDSAPAWAPDGTKLAFFRLTGETSDLLVVDATGANPRIVAKDLQAPRYLTWQPLPVALPQTPAAAQGANGEIWFRRGSGKGGMLIESIDPDGANRQVLFRDTYDGGTDNLGDAYDWSPDGSQVAFIDSTRYIGEVPTGSSWDVYTMNADGTGRRQVTDDGAFDAAPSWSPDGTRIVYASDKGDPDRPACEMRATCNRDVFAMNADGSAQVQLTSEPGADWQPDWGPDGRIVFVSDRDDAAGDIYVMNADGTGVTRITNTPEDEYQPRWSPDGTHIAFVRSDGKSAALFVMDADGSNEIQIAGDLATSFSVEPDILDDFAWSSDGTMLAFAGGAEYSTTLFVIGADGQGLRTLVEEPQYGVGGPAWRPALSGSDTRTGQAAAAVLTPAPRECPVGIGFLRHPRAEAWEVPEAMHGHLPAGFPNGFGLQVE